MAENNNGNEKSSVVRKRVRPQGIPRVEGHGGIVLEILNDQVKKVNVEIYEGPRLFEQLVIGKTPVEDLALTSRICAICTLSHRYAAIRGIEKAMGYSDLSEKVHLTRELMHAAEVIESNALHVFILSAPDLLGYPSVVHAYKHHPELVQRALRYKQLGTTLMQLTSARKIHGENPTVGGFNKFPDHESLLSLKDQITSLLPSLIDDVKTLASLDVPSSYLHRDMIFMSVVPESGRYGWVADTIGVMGPDKDIHLFSAENYQKLTNERTVAHSFAKRCRYNEQPFTVGALARVLIQRDRLEGTMRELATQLITEEWYHNPIYNIHAQALELIFAFERVNKLIDRIVQLDDVPLVPPPRQSGEGVGVVEAPRGLLYHHYKIKDGKIDFCNIITPTAQFLDDMEASLYDAATILLEQKQLSDEELRDELETIARSYDPCISCSVHMVSIKRI